MTGVVSYEDIAIAMNRSPAVVKAWASLSKPKSMAWQNIRIGSGKQPTRFYDVEDAVSWLARSYSHFDGLVEKRIREIAQANLALYKVEAA